jgi:SAM-dependent methyltransferase
VYSREAVERGSFDQYVQSIKGKRGTTPVDAEFLKEIEGWREVLARNLALRNAALSIDELNDAVQRTIDRIIFLRMAEDRGIEPYARLQTLAAQDEIYAGLLDLCRQADAKYNSGLFDFSAKGDRLTPKLIIDDKVLKPILSDLYFPHPYEFSVMPTKILGNVYEQFLGKVIRLTPAHQAKVEEKPEVKKAGGIRYTPDYIVDNIVTLTIGQWIAAHVKPTDRRPLPLTFRVLDISCGSGSFALGAYQYLLDYHLQWYIDHNPEKHSKAVRQTSGGEWRLTVAEKKRILTAHIFGVDIDRQAVEVTKLSLLLKVLEGENDESLQLKLFDNERALPNLDANIKCGNSLIGPDYFTDQLLPDEDEMKRVNPFDWAREFPEAMKAGGFDVVLGNPPYVDIKGMPISDVEYMFAKYPSANNRINLFAVFIERALGLVNEAHFRLGMIVPTSLLTQESYKALRQRIIRTYQLTHIVRLPNESFGQKAGEVKVDTATIVFGSPSGKDIQTEIIGYSGYERIQRIDAATASVHSFVRQSTWLESADAVWSINTTESDVSILTKCEEGTIPLEECAEFCLGLTPYDKYKGHTPQQIANRVFHADHQVNKTYKRLLAGNDVVRYQVRWNGTEWISYGPWLGASREPRFFTQRRILVKQIIDWTTKQIWASITDEELYNTQNAFNLLAKSGWNLNYLLGILNSRLMTFYHRKKYLDEFKMRFQKILIKDCRRFPIRTIDFTHAADKTAHDRMVKLVDTMLQLHPRLVAAQAAHDRDLIQRQIDATDQQIDALVYQLYGLTAEEIKIVEGQS